MLHLKYYNACIEASLADHKKATNVFILLASEKGFLDQVCVETVRATYIKIYTIGCTIESNFSWFV